MPDQIDHTKELAAAAKDAQSLLASQASDALKVISDAAAKQLEITATQSKGDHDFMLTFSAIVNTKLDQLFSAVKEVTTNTTGKILALEQGKLDKCDSYPIRYQKEVEEISTDHEKRIRSLSSFRDTLSGKMWGIGITASVIMTGIGILIAHFWK